MGKNKPGTKFQDGSILKLFQVEQFFLKKLVPDQNFQRNKISITNHQILVGVNWISKHGSLDTDALF